MTTRARIGRIARAFGCLGRLAGCGVLVLAPLASAAGHMVIVAGLGGEPEYASAFASQARTAARSAERLGADVTLLVAEDARRDAIRDALAARAGGRAEDPVVVMLIGHGSYDGEHYRFNVPGPDPTAEDLAAWLAPVRASRQLVVVATSASGAAIEVLRDEHRAVITATKDGQEANAVIFGRFWAAALEEARADVDKDGRVDADEAFRFAEQAVAAHYEASQRIATEHPRREGETARFVLAAPAAARALELDASSPAIARRAELLDEIDVLRASKGEHLEEDYFARLQELLLELSSLEDGRDLP